MAQMFQMSTIAGLQKTSSRADDIELQSATDIPVTSCSCRDLLLELGLKPTDVVADANAVKVAGEDYRPGLFVLTEANPPTFALIQKVYVMEAKVFLLIVPWQIVEFTDRYCAYQVKPSGASAIILRQTDLARHGTFAPWNPWQQRSTFIAPRTIIF